MNAEKQKDAVAHMMRHSLVELPFSDFDQRMMMQIRREAEVMATSKKDKNRAALFFTLGCLFGAILSNWLVFGFSAELNNVKILVQAVGVLTFLLFVRSAYNLLMASKPFEMNS